MHSHCGLLDILILFISQVARADESYAGYSDTLQARDENISWAAYHASLQPPTSESSVALTSLLPLFHDEAKSVAMIRHAMDVHS